MRIRQIKSALTWSLITASSEGSNATTKWNKNPAKQIHSHEDECLANPLGPQSKICEAIPRGGHSHAHTVAEAAEVIKHAPPPYGLSLTTWKAILQLLLTTLNIVFWLIPLRHEKFTENKLALSLANAFSGGVFLCLAFGHLIPECMHGFHGYNEALPFMVVLGGYLLIFFVEKVAFDTHIYADMHEVSHHGHGPLASEVDGDDIKEPVQVNGDEKAKEAVAVNGGHMAPPSTQGKPVSGRSAILLLAALGVHSVLEMMALGLANNFTDAALLFLSISLHQPAESIALLVSFLKSGLPKRQIIQFLSVFSALGPIGVFLGVLVNRYASPFLDAVMLAIVAGTFVYVGATEVIPEEWEDSQHKWKKFFSLIAGIVTIFGITQYTMMLDEKNA